MGTTAEFNSERSDTVTAKNATMVCQCCLMRVRYSKTAKAWFHVNGNPETETIARETMRYDKARKPMKPVMPDQVTLDVMPYPTKEIRKPPVRKINNIRIVNGRV